MHACTLPTATCTHPSQHPHTSQSHTQASHMHKPVTHISQPHTRQSHTQASHTHKPVTHTQASRTQASHTYKTVTHTSQSHAQASRTHASSTHKPVTHIHTHSEAHRRLWLFDKFLGEAPWLREGLGGVEGAVVKRGVGQGFQSLLTAYGSRPQGGGAEVLGGGPFVPFLLLHTHTHTQKWIWTLLTATLNLGVPNIHITSPATGTQFYHTRANQTFEACFAASSQSDSSGPQGQTTI